jgi:hypothetical protein
LCADRSLLASWTWVRICNLIREQMEKENPHCAEARCKAHFSQPKKNKMMISYDLKLPRRAVV